MNHNEELVNQFQDYLIKHNLSKGTVVSYTGTMRQFYRLYSEVDPDTMREFRNILIMQYKPSTVNQKIIAVNRFADFIEETYGEDASVIRDYRLNCVKVQHKSFHDTIISNEDYEKMKANLKAEGNDFWYFVVRFLGATGARVSELTKIKVEHLRAGYLDIYTKGGKLRRIYLPDSLCCEALDWCKRCGKESGFLFLNKEGHLISARGINSQLKHYAVKYGIDPDTVYPHSFRHRFAKNFLEYCGDIALLADLMGHDSIETTRIYLTKTSKEQQEFLDDIITW